MRVRRASTDDLSALRSLRRVALTTHPTSFGTSAEEEEATTDDAWRARFLPGSRATVFLAESDDAEPLGLAGVRGDGRVRTGHVADLWGVFVLEAARGAGVGDALVAESIVWARDAGYARMRLFVDTLNMPAIRLYQRHGFVVVGCEPDVIRVGDDRRDEYLMHYVLR